MSFPQSKYIIIDIRSGRQFGLPIESYDSAVDAAKSVSACHPEMIIKIEEV